jgi:hypothetical protein
MRSVVLASLSITALAGCALTGEPRYQRPFVIASDSASSSDGAVMDGAVMDGTVIGQDVVAMGDAVAADRVAADDVIEIDLDATSGDALVGCAIPLSNCDDQCVNLQNNPRNCGGCSRVCPAGPNSSAICSMGMCSLACAVGFGNCDGDPTNGCETPLGTPANCSTCGNQCLGAPNAVPTCTMGTCGSICRSGFGNCDGDPTNGCESSLATNEHCGSCGTRCSAPTPVCDAARSMCVAPGCTSGTSYCMTEMTCVNTNTDPRHCGSCGNICLAGPNSTPICNAGICGISCQTGFADCDMRPGTGCEINTQTDVNNCGGCGRVCPSGPGGHAVCVAGRCDIACDPGRLNCDGNASNGCESLALSNDNCGACGMSCGLAAVCTSVAGSAPACVPAPLCSIVDNVRCGFGCVDVETDANNCGACNNRCRSQGTREGVCNGGRCLLCPIGTQTCNAGANRGRCCTGALCTGACVAPMG